MSNGQLPPSFGGGTMTPIDPPSGGGFKMPPRPDAPGKPASAPSAGGLQPVPAAAPAQPPAPPVAPAPAPAAPSAPEPSVAQLPREGVPNGLLCPKCGYPQFEAAGGAACQSGCGPTPGVHPSQFRSAAAPASPAFDPSVFAPRIAPPVPTHDPQSGVVPYPGPSAAPGAAIPAVGPRVPDLEHAKAQFEAGLAAGPAAVEPPRTKVQPLEDARRAFEDDAPGYPTPEDFAAAFPASAAGAPTVTAAEPVFTIQVTLKGSISRLHGALEALRNMGVLG